MAIGHGHGHDHSPAGHEVEAASVRRLLGIAVGSIALAALVGLAAWWPRGDADLDRESLGFSDRVKAVVTSSETGPCAAADPGPATDPTAESEVGTAPAFECVVVTTRLTSGPDAGDTATLETSADFESPVSRLAPGDAIMLNDAGGEVPAEVRYSFADLQRSRPLVVLAVVFAVVVVTLGRLRGFLALAGIALSLAVILVFIFPALLDGAAPVGVALTGATVIAFGTLYLAHGLNDRTTVALPGVEVLEADSAAGSEVELFQTHPVARDFAGAVHQGCADSRPRTARRVWT